MKHLWLSGDATRAVAMPIGGIGTGSIALAGDGSLRQWQIHNQANHQACVPHSFFAIRIGDVCKVLQSAEHYGDADSGSPATCSDAVVPIPHQRLLAKLPGVASTRFSGNYPFGTVRYEDDALPLSVEMTAWNPMVPFDAAASGIPAIEFEFALTNPTDHAVAGALLFTMQNAVGWDGVAAIFDTACDLYGGNHNDVYESAGARGVRMSNAFLPESSEHNGEMLITTDAGDPQICTQWSQLSNLWKSFEAGEIVDSASAEPSAKGKTWNSAISVPFEMEAGEEQTIRFQLAWHFPNRYVNYPQHEFLGVHDQKSRFWIGNDYANRFEDVADVADHFWQHRDSLHASTLAFAQSFTESTLPEPLVQTVTSQMSVMRTPTVFWGEDSRLYGFEGCSGYSTAHHTKGYEGCCPLNCTHVWNYEQSLAYLYPDLERTMRDTEWQLQQHASGYLPHRVTLPLYMPRRWGGFVGAPDKPALDGLLGAILKTWREFRNTGDVAWLESAWPHIQQALAYIREEHDPEQQGTIEGEQPNTYDISIFGLNTFIGTLYIAALEAAAAIAGTLGDPDRAGEFRAIAAKGRTILDDRLWNGDYYIQEVDLAKHSEQNWATGCHADHLLGQWWAAGLQLPDTLDSDRLRTAVQNIYNYNFRPTLEDIPAPERWFANPKDAGLLNCTWPKNGRPEVPTRYSDEVWTGIEYEVAGLLLFNGDVEEALSVLSAVRNRYNGERMNPWNDIECGDHYVRAMSSWSLLHAATRFGWNRHEGALSLGNGLGKAELRAPFFAAPAWGSFEMRDGAVNIAVTQGTLDLRSISLERVAGPPTSISLDGQVVEFDLTADGTDEFTIRFSSMISIPAGASIQIALD